MECAVRENVKRFFSFFLRGGGGGGGEQRTRERLEILTSHGSLLLERDFP